MKLGAYSATHKLRFALSGDLPQSVTDHLLKLQSRLRLWLVTAADQHHFKHHRKNIVFGQEGLIWVRGGKGLRSN